MKTTFVKIVLLAIGGFAKPPTLSNTFVLEIPNHPVAYITHLYKKENSIAF